MNIIKTNIQKLHNIPHNIEKLTSDGLTYNKHTYNLPNNTKIQLKNKKENTTLTFSQTIQTITITQQYNPTQKYIITLTDKQQNTITITTNNTPSYTITLTTPTPTKKKNKKK